MFKQKRDILQSSSNQDGGLPSWFLQLVPVCAFLPSLYSSLLAVPQLGQCSFPTRMTAPPSHWWSWPGCWLSSANVYQFLDPQITLRSWRHQPRLGVTFTKYDLEVHRNLHSSLVFRKMSKISKYVVYCNTDENLLSSPLVSLHTPQLAGTKQIF